MADQISLIVSPEETDKILETKSNLAKLGLQPGSSSNEQKLALKWALLSSYIPRDVPAIEKQFVQHVEYSLAQTRMNLTPRWSFQAVALSVRDRLLEHWKDTQIYFHEKGCKRVAYLSLEFLIGRSLQNAILNLDIKDNYTEAMYNLGINLEEIYDQERDAGLGNGGLGRLAACFLDSLATLDYPAWGYGLRYNYGMFHQKIRGGEQVEFPDYWLYQGSAWEIQRLDVVQPVRFYGQVTQRIDDDGNQIFNWEGGEEVLAVAYDLPIPGYKTFNTLNIRLWGAAPSKEFDLENFNKGDFYKSVEERQKAEAITHVLYPNDNTDKGKELRLKQQYFFVCATINDMVRRFKRRHSDFSKFPEMVAIQLNDTHPSLAIPELFRVLIDQERLSFLSAWHIVERTFSYTNHTVLPEALEKWPVSLMENLLPRHMKIIYEINLHFLQLVEEQWPGDVDRIRNMSIIEEHPVRAVRMANLAIVLSHSVNGVAALHSKLLVGSVFPYFHEFFPEKFQNKTNGVTPRRWIHQANPQLSQLITEYLGSSDWLLNLDLVKNLSSNVNDPVFRKKFVDIKFANKVRLAQLVEKKLGIKIDPTMLFDIQVKRIHEYKRQLMNILSVIYRYRMIKHMTKEQKEKVTPRAVFFGGKAAPGYFIAKKVIKLICSVAEVINNDPSVNQKLKVVFIPNYCVSLAEIIIPASDISQHISTAGMEASGTSNMKFTMNGGIILGTLDGANIEIREEVGEENMFIFGALTEDVPRIRKQISSGLFKPGQAFKQALGLLHTGLFGNPEIYTDLLNSIQNGNDYYLVSYDFDSYLDAQQVVDQAYLDKEKWTTMSIYNTIRSGLFSSDRTIHQYAQDIWNIQPVRRPGPINLPVENLRASNTGISLDSFTDCLKPGDSRAISLERLSPSTMHHKPSKKKGSTNLAPGTAAKKVVRGFNL